MTQGPDLGAHPTLGSEGIVGRHAAVVVEAHDLAEVRIHVLCRREFLALAGTDPQHAVAIEGDTMPEVAAATRFRHLPPDDLGIGEIASTTAIEDQPGACHRGATAARTGLGIA